MSIAVATATTASIVGRTIRVMVVDDAAVARRLVTRWVGAEPDMTVAASLRNGREAVEQLEASNPDVVVLDVDMPELDGIAALPLLLTKKRDLTVIMASALTRRGAEISLRALSLDAADYVPKPDAATDSRTSAAFRSELIDKIRRFGRRGRSPARAGLPAPKSPKDPPQHEPRPAAPCSREEVPSKAVRGQHFAQMAPRALLIGASTGGPQALAVLLEKLTAAIDSGPVLIAQHMPATFTTVLAEHLTRVAGRGAHEAEHGELVLPGGIYVAPGGRHMRVVRAHDGVRIALGNDPPINFCKPAVDALFSSAAAVWGAGALALVLTGMGCDGTRGAADVVAAGGSVIAQDEASSVVWGMPRSVARAGLCSAVLPLDEIAPRVIRLFSGGHA